MVPWLSRAVVHRSPSLRNHAWGLNLEVCSDKTVGKVDSGIYDPCGRAKPTC